MALELVAIVLIAHEGLTMSKHFQAKTLIMILSVATLGAARFSTRLSGLF
jgi:hypothetical protein